MQPLILFGIQFVSNIVGKFILPLMLTGVALGIVSNISSKIQINKLSTIFKKSTIWIMGIVFTILLSAISIEGSLTSSVDGTTSKITKSAVSTFVPVVGKILGDSVDTVLGASNILKNAVGILGIIAILGICIVPIIKLCVLTVIFFLMSSLVEPIADEKITKLLSTIGDGYKILLGIMFAISFLFIMGVTLMIKLSNSTLMYG